MSGNWAPDGAATEGGTVGGADAGNGMDERRQRDEDLERVLDALEQERTAAADLNSALIASESRVAALERRLGEASAAAASIEEVRAQVAEQAELAEKYRIEAVETQTMFDAMQHRIDSLSAQVAKLKSAAPPPAEAPPLDVPSDAGQAAALEAALAESARLAKQLAERETTLAATRRARDQWLERLEQSGRERERLRERLVEHEKGVAALQSAAAVAEQAQRRAVDLEAELAVLQELLEERDAAPEGAGEQAAAIERLRAELRQTEDVWERAETEKESLAEQLAAAQQRVADLESLAEQLAAAQQRVAELEGAAERVALDREAGREEEQGALEQLRQEAVRLESERDALRREAAELRAQIERVEAALVEQAAAREELQQELATTRADGEEAALAQRRDLEADLDAARAQAEQAAHAIAAEQARGTSLEEQLERLRGEREEALQRERGLADRLAEMERSSRDSSEGVAAVEAERSALAEDLAAARAEAARWQAEVEERERQDRDVRERLGTAEKEREALAAEVARRDDSAAGLLAKIEGFAAQQEGTQEEQARLAEQASRLRDEVEAVSGLLDEVRQQMHAEAGPLDALEQRLEAGLNLQGQLEEERSRRVSLEWAQREASEASEEDRRHQASLDAEIERLRSAVSALEEERDGLNEAVEARRQAEGALRAEIERLQGHVQEGSAREDGELERLRSHIEKLERERDELVVGHTSEVSSYRNEIAQHVEAIGQRESELDRLVRECTSLQQAVDEAIGELEGIRSERQDLEARLGALRDEAPSGFEGLPDLEALVASAVADGDGDGDVEADIEAVAKLAAVVESAGEADGLPYVLHFDGSQESRAAVETAVGKVRGARYGTDPENEVPAGMRPVLAFNLATDAVNPLATLASASRWGIEEARAIVYCVKGDRGVFFGRVEFFPAPCDPKACARRLLERSDGGLQRLLAVGEEIDLMSGLREELGRSRCSTAIAFDGRQAMDLIPMVKPQVVLVDLNLPRGDGLRVASQIRANPDTAGLSVAMFWSNPIDPLVFRQQAIYAMRDFTLSQEELTRKFADALLRFEEPIVGAQKGGRGRGRPGAPASR